jgi:hypothetical protein
VIDDEIRALMVETQAALERGELMPPKVEWWWEPRRAGEMTPEYLGRVLGHIGLPDLPDLPARARLGHFDDFHAPADVADGFELVRVVVELRRAAERVTDAYGHPFRMDTMHRRREQIAAVENAVRRGEFDATKAESDRWAASKNGQDTFGELAASAVNDYMRRRRPEDDVRIGRSGNVAGVALAHVDVADVGEQEAGGADVLAQLLVEQRHEIRDLLGRVRWRNRTRQTSPGSARRPRAWPEARRRPVARASPRALAVRWPRRCRPGAAGGKPRPGPSATGAAARS